MLNLASCTARTPPKCALPCALAVRRALNQHYSSLSWARSHLSCRTVSIPPLSICNLSSTSLASPNLPHPLPPPTIAPSRQIPDRHRGDHFSTCVCLHGLERLLHSIGFGSADLTQSSCRETVPDPSETDGGRPRYDLPHYQYHNHGQQQARIPNGRLDRHSITVGVVFQTAPGCPALPCLCWPRAFRFLRRLFVAVIWRPKPNLGVSLPRYFLASLFSISRATNFFFFPLPYFPYIPASLLQPSLWPFCLLISASPQPSNFPRPRSPIWNA